MVLYCIEYSVLFSLSGGKKSAILSLSGGKKSWVVVGADHSRPVWAEPCVHQCCTLLPQAAQATPLTCVGEDNTWCCGCCGWSPLPILVGIADDGTADTVAVVTVLPLPLGLCPCECDWSLSAVCCVVAVGDDEEFEVVATEFCCPPAAIE